MSYRHIIRTGCIYAFVLLFTYAAVSKLLDFETFTVQLAQSPLLSAYAGVIAWVVPGVELGLSGLLLLERFRVPALYACFTLMVMFTAYIVIILHFSDFVPCSCGGVLEQLSWNQHLVFNVFFIVLAGVALWLSSTTAPLKLLVSLLSLTIIGTAVIALLFVFSEKKMHRNNAFIRRYPHHPATKIKSVDLSYNSYYIAGLTKDSIYLGNTTAPLHILSFSKEEPKAIQQKLTLPDTALSFRSLQTKVHNNVVYTFDGSIPVLYNGTLENYRLKPYYNIKQSFLRLQPISPSKFIIRVFNTNSTYNELGILSLTETNLQTQIRKQVLKAKGDPFFDTDGLLLYNKQLNKVLYIYFYRNEYISTDTSLTQTYVHNTIDTISKSQLDIRTLTSRNQRKLGTQPIFVNKRAATHANYLYIQSDRLGKHEPDGILDSASIIDVYNLKKQQYAFSFYLYHEGMRKLQDFQVYNNYLYALIDKFLVIYKLDTKILKQYE